MIVHEQAEPLVRGIGQMFSPQSQVMREWQGGERAGPVLLMLPHTACETLEIGVNDPIAGENELEALGAVGDDGREVPEDLVRAGRCFRGRCRVPDPSSESRHAGTIGRTRMFDFATVPVLGGDGLDVVKTALKLLEIDDDAFACVDVFSELRQESVQVSLEPESYPYPDHGTCGGTIESPDEIRKIGVFGPPRAIAQLLQLLDDLTSERQHHSDVVVDAGIEYFDCDVYGTAGGTILPELEQKISTSLGIM